MTNAISRIRYFWQDHGEWVLLAIVGVLFATGGYSLSSYQHLRVAIEGQKMYQAELDRRTTDWSKERDYFRGNAEKKNEDIRYLTARLAAAGIDATSTAKTAAETVKALTDTAVKPASPETPQ